MATGWVELAEYVLSYPEDDVLSPPLFERLATDAVSRIMRRTFRRAAVINEYIDPDEWDVLANCEKELIHTLNNSSKIVTATGGGIMQSATTDGYSESYATYSNSGKTLPEQIDMQCNGIIEKHLSSNEVTNALLNYGVV